MLSNGNTKGATAKLHSIAAKRVVKLQYLPDYRVLICTECAYCVLPRALDRHLKVIHHLPAIERKRHHEYVRKVDLASLDEIEYPEPGSDPIPGLPTFDGYRCGAKGCQYLCVTNKRMQAHWRMEHAGLDDLLCHQVKLQTFFRGNNLHYFPVAWTDAAGPPKDLAVFARTDAHPLSVARVADESLARTGTSLITAQPFNADAFGSATFPFGTDVLHISDSFLQRSPSESRTIENAVEWLLTRQFCDESYGALQPVKGSSTSWRNEVLQACSEATFLRYAVLSLAANHIAFACDGSRRLYSQEANIYRDLAIKALTVHVSEVNPENFFTVFSFTRLMTLCCLAGVQLTKLTGQYGSTTTKSMLPEWFPIQIQGKNLIWPHKGGGRMVNAMHAPAESLAMSNSMTDHDLYLNPFDQKLYDLVLALKSMTDYKVHISCLEALDALRKVWATPYRDDYNGFRDVALMWPTRVPLIYLTLVESHDPVALVVFAHYWVLWSLSEGYYWYMKGHAETMLFRIVQRLEWQWQEW